MNEEIKSCPFCIGSDIELCHDNEQRWIPFTEQRPPEDESRYAVHVWHGIPYWTPLPPPPVFPEKEITNLGGTSTNEKV